jgi:hypothetical protein
MRLRPLAGLAAATSLLLGAPCGTDKPRIVILSPDAMVTTFAFEIEFHLMGPVDPASLEVTLNGVSIDDRVTGGPTSFVAQIEPGAPLRDDNLLKIKADRALLNPQDHPRGKLVETLPFAYLPPGKARARRIADASELIRGPLGHSRVGDWLLGNGVARFAIQDVGQRELYSVGQYGGNVIDAEVIGNPGKDNFLELQPGLNIETVINAQTVEIVNDGQDGTAAVIRTCGPDDLLDFVNPSSQVVDLGLPFPALANDRDLEIEGCSSYGLAPEKSHLRIDTEVFNNEPTGGAAPDPLPLLVGDWLNPSGELDTYTRAPGANGPVTPSANGVGSPVASFLGALGFYGYDEAAGVDYSFTQVPLAPPNAATGSFVSVSGVLVVLHSQNVLLTLIGADPARFRVASGGSGTFTRYFAVGDGSPSHAVDLENEVFARAAGILQGCLSVAGAPVAGAHVSIGTGFGLATQKLASHFVSEPGPCPNYGGSVPPGSYQVAAGLEGHPYEGGAAVPPPRPAVIAAGITTSLNFDLPATGRLRVVVSDESGAPLPSRVTVVGFDPSPEPTVAGPSLPGFGSSRQGLLYDTGDRVPFGIAAVGYAGASGEVEVPLEPGTRRYHVYVSRGTEYSAFRTTTPISVAANATTLVNARITRLVDTAGFVSSDFHVHGIRSADSRVSDVHRVESYSAEGVENVIMTDHHVHTDLRPAIAAEGLAGFLTATIGEEITSFDYGHWNAYPLLIDPASPHATFTPDGLTQLSGGSTDWAQAAPPGRDFPAYGALNATPAEIDALATAGALSTPHTTIQVNHIDSHFRPLAIDTSLVPPRDLMSDADRANRRLPDTASVSNLFHHFPALELWNGDNRNDQRQFVEERVGIWFNHLNQGLRTTFIADTDSHSFTNLNTAGARTWTASPTDAPAAIDPGDVADAVAAGRAVGGQGVYVQARLVATDGSGDSADLAWGGDTTVTDAGGNVNLEISVQSPAWARWDRVEIYANAATLPAAASPFLFGATPTLVLDEGDCNPATLGDGAFDVSVTRNVAGVPGADLLSASFVVPFSGLVEPTWFVVVVKGTDGECAPMFPVYPDDLAQASNATLANLVDGNVGEGGVLALGATNALYFEP